MNRSRIAGIVLVAFVACGIVWAQDAPKPTAKAAAEKAAGRLPNNFAKLGITDAQRQKIYSLQAKYNDQIEVLMKQVEDLRSKRDTEVEGVLTPEQRDKLKTLQKDAAAKKADAKPDGKEGDK
jgi:Spy/CpxP family protein refolding chaperone